MNTFVCETRKRDESNAELLSRFRARDFFSSACTSFSMTTDAEHRAVFLLLVGGMHAVLTSIGTQQHSHIQEVAFCAGGAVAPPLRLWLSGQTHRAPLLQPHRRRIPNRSSSLRFSGRAAAMPKLMEEEVFMAFTTYATIVLLKMLLMAPMTAYCRFSRGAFANEEDVALKPAEERKKLLRTHPDVERVRRCHLNDLENVVPFVLIGLLYALTGPQLSAALLHFRVFAGCRVLHSVSYVCGLPQPSRALAWALGLLVTLSMAYSVLSTVLVL